MKKKIIAIIVFAACLILAVSGANRVLTYKSVEGQGHWCEYYKEKEDTIDVLFLGSSHVMRQINPAVIFHESGVSSFDIATGGEVPWSTYYCMEEALKYQHPKVVVVDIYMMRFAEEYYKDTHNIIATFGMKRDDAWYGSIKAGVEKNKSWYYLRYPLYHGRYNELSSVDFESDDTLYQGLLKGFWVDDNNWKVKEIEEITFDDYEQKVSDWNVKCEEYLMKMIQLAKKSETELILMQTPGVLTETETKLYNNIRHITEREGVVYWEGNAHIEEIGLNTASDFRDKDHMNWRGTNKFSSWLGRWLSEEYALEDHRGDSRYSSWEQDYDIWNELIANHELTLTESVSDFFDKADANRYTVAVSIGPRVVELEGNDKDAMLRFGVSEDVMRNGGVYVIRDGKVVFSKQASKEGVYYAEWFDDQMKVESSEGSPPKILFNGDNIIKTNEGLSVFVYDDKYEQQVDNVGFIVAENFAPMR